jgi:glycosyltransferase involved in cell wall biosynthesis
MQNYGGISRVFTELYKEFGKSGKVEPILPVLLSDNEYIGEIKKVWTIFPNNKSFFKKLFYYVVNRIYSTFVLLKGDFDIFIPTYYDPYFLPFLKGKPFVLVLHDMTHEIFPDTVSKKDMTVKWKKELVYMADKIIAISENTKKDIVKFYDIDKDKIEVVYWGTSIVVPKEKIDIDLPERYILFVGNRGTYKNFELFFKSVSTLLKNDKDLYLVCAGSGKFNDREIEMFTNSEVLDKVRHIRFKDDVELAYIYSKATCFVFPSLYEGFGIPVLEAFASNCPAVISNTSSLPEVGGNAVEYFNPEDINSMHDAVKTVVEDSKLRKEMTRKGRERLKLFSWEITARKLLIYKDINR